MEPKEKILRFTIKTRFDTRMDFYEMSNKQIRNWAIEVIPQAIFAECIDEDLIESSDLDERVKWEYIDSSNLVKVTFWMEVSPKCISYDGEPYMFADQFCARHKNDLNSIWKSIYSQMDEYVRDRCEVIVVSNRNEDFLMQYLLLAPQHLIVESGKEKTNG